MPGKAHALFAVIASFPALHVAALHATTGKRRKPGVAAFLADLEKPGAVMSRLRPACRSRRCGNCAMDEPPGGPNVTNDQPSTRGAESGVTTDEPSGRGAASGVASVLGYRSLPGAL